MRPTAARRTLVTQVLSCSLGAAPAATLSTSSRTSSASAGSMNSLPEHLPPDLLGLVLECLLERDVRAALRETTRRGRSGTGGSARCSRSRSGRRARAPSPPRASAAPSPRCPETRTSASVRPVTSATGTAVHANARTAPVRATELGLDLARKRHPRLPSRSQRRRACRRPRSRGRRRGARRARDRASRAPGETRDSPRPGGCPRLGHESSRFGRVRPRCSGSTRASSWSRRVRARARARACAAR